MMLRPVSALIFAAALMASVPGCASDDTAAATNRAVQDTRSGAVKAAMTPLRDLNLHRDEIPPVLADIENPYDIPVDTPCPVILEQLAALDIVLGPDADAAPRHEDDPTVQDYAADEVSDELIDIIADEAGAIIPYRSWVRRATGAKSYQKKVDRAIKRGSLRRAYLRALGAAKGCSESDPSQIEPLVASVQAEPPLPPVDYSETAPPQYRSPEIAAPDPYIPALRDDTADAMEEAYDWPEEWSQTEAVSPDPAETTSSPPTSN